MSIENLRKEIKFKAQQKINKIVKKTNGGFTFGMLSDGYHTFDELYAHRMILFSVICNQNKDQAWKSWLHSDGTMFDNYFIVGITTIEGDFTYHYHKSDWARFEVEEFANAPEWDGHTSWDIVRLNSLIKQ